MIAVWNHDGGRLRVVCFAVQEPSIIWALLFLRLLAPDIICRTESPESVVLCF